MFSVLGKLILYYSVYPHPTLCYIYSHTQTHDKNNVLKAYLVILAQYTFVKNRATVLFYTIFTALALRSLGLLWKDNLETHGSSVKIIKSATIKQKLLHTSFQFIVCNNSTDKKSLIPSWGGKSLKHFGVGCSAGGAFLGFTVQTAFIYVPRKQ